MIFGHLSAVDAYRHLLAVPAWRFAFDWLRALPENPEAGIRQLQGEDMYVNVHGYDTLPREQCRFESHRRYVDLQYCLRGGELIDWQLASTLRATEPFQPEKDLQFYEPGLTLTSLHLTPGSFAIFYPSDGHRPKCADGLHQATYKLVIKLDARLLA